MRILHFLGGSTIDLSGTRAIAQTKMTISQRAKVEGVLCDVVCTGRFYDFFEKRGRWGLVLRQPIYEKDRLDPLDPSAKLELDQELLARFPGGLPPPRLSADAHRLHGEARHAGAGWAGGGGAVREGGEVVGGRLALAGHSGAPRSGEPGIHNHRQSRYREDRGYGFRPSLRSAGMTQITSPSQ